MKKIFLIPFLLLLIVASSCKKEPIQSPASQDEQVLSNESRVSQNQPIFGTCADWRIGSFKHGFIDETRNFRLLKLMFCPDNSVVLHNDIFAINGNWYILLSNNNPQYLVLNFNLQSPETGGFYNAAAAGIQGTWQIQKLQNNVLWLRSTTGAKTMMLEKASWTN